MPASAVPNISIPTDANARNLTELLKGKKYQIDFYQREYRWEPRHVEELMIDLTDRFLSNYDSNHSRLTDGPKYGHYFLGPIILSKKNGEFFIIDGQQRLTTLTLLLIYLNHLQSSLQVEKPTKLDEFICSEFRGEVSFNINVPDREQIVRALYENLLVMDPNGYEGSARNIHQRYHDLDSLFPDEIKNEHGVLMFIDWLVLNVDLVEIVAYSDEEAYAIFESMNDRGLKLNPTEMLKGYLLANIDSDSKKSQANEIWKKRVQELINIHKDEESDFFKNWLRAKYAKTVRAGNKGAVNQDYEKIGNEYHKWVRDQKEMIGLGSSQNYWDFVTLKFENFSKRYIRILNLAKKFTQGFEEVYYNAYNNFTLQYQLMLSPLCNDDDQTVIDKKIKLVSYYIDYFIVHRAVNYLTLSYSALRYTMAVMMIEMRDMPLDNLHTYLKNKALEIVNYFDGSPEYSRRGIPGFGLNQWSKRYIRYILARMTAYVEVQSAKPDKFVDYSSPYIKRPYEIEHIWADHYEQHKEEFVSPNEFMDFRNLLGGLVLLPKSINQSLNDMAYQQKLPYYIKENLLTQSLHPQAYQRNPDFYAFVQRSGLPFESYQEFKKEDIIARTLLYKNLCEQIWSVDRFDRILNDN